MPLGRANICIVRKSFEPTHFNIVMQESNCSNKLIELTVQPGRQNCFETILLFLLLLRKIDNNFGSNSEVGAKNKCIQSVFENIFGSSSDVSFKTFSRFNFR